MTIVQINTFRPSLRHSVTESQSFRFSLKISADPPLTGGPEPTFSGSDTQCAVLDLGTTYFTALKCCVEIFYSGVSDDDAVKENTSLEIIVPDCSSFSAYSGEN